MLSPGKQWAALYTTTTSSSSTNIGLSELMLTHLSLLLYSNIQGDQKVSVHLMITVKKHAKILWPSQNTFGMWIVLYWTRSSRTHFGVSINVWRLAGGGGTLRTNANVIYGDIPSNKTFTVFQLVFISSYMLRPAYNGQLQALAWGVLHKI
jgi:hypothetical protein